MPNTGNYIRVIEKWWLHPESYIFEFKLGALLAVLFCLGVVIMVILQMAIVTFVSVSLCVFTFALAEFGNCFCGAANGDAHSYF